MHEPSSRVERGDIVLVKWNDQWLRAIACAPERTFDGLPAVMVRLRVPASPRTIRFWATQWRLPGETTHGKGGLELRAVNTTASPLSTAKPSLHQWRPWKHTTIFA